MRRALTIIALLVTALATCHHVYGFDEEQARRDVEQIHPEWSIVDMGVGEGDSDSAYMNIHYRIAGSPAIHSAEWQYLWEDGRWVLRSRYEPSEQSSNRERQRPTTQVAMRRA